jgi:hypothetical protein
MKSFFVRARTAYKNFTVTRYFEVFTTVTLVVRAVTPYGLVG